jgi:hypothetical protein
MQINYSAVDDVLDRSFARLGASPNLGFPHSATLSEEFKSLIGEAAPTLVHSKWRLPAAAGVEMWHRAIHSFLCSVALREMSPLWSSVVGYYASHYVMRAFAHSMGIFKSFSAKRDIQVELTGNHFSVRFEKANNRGEHNFYWYVIKEHPKFIGDSLFRYNSEKAMYSESQHRNFANYTDCIDTFAKVNPPPISEISMDVQKISGIRLDSVGKPEVEKYPDLETLQVLAFHRILAFQTFIDDRVTNNPFWRTHREPMWCKDIMLFQTPDLAIDLRNIGR